MAVNGFGIRFLLALTMVIIFLKFVRVFTPTPTTILPKPPRSRWSTAATRSSSARRWPTPMPWIVRFFSIGGLEGAATDYGLRYHLFR
jgi:hypothetical protein